MQGRLGRNHPTTEHTGKWPQNAFGRGVGADQFQWAQGGKGSWAQGGGGEGVLTLVEVDLEFSERCTGGGVC